MTMSTKPTVRFDVNRCGWIYEEEARDLVRRIFRVRCEPLPVIVQSRTASGRWGSRKVKLAQDLWPDVAEEVRRERKIDEIFSTIPEAVRTEVECHLKAGRLESTLQRARDLADAIERLLPLAAPGGQSGSKL